MCMQYFKTEDKLLVYCLKAHFNCNSNTKEIIKTILKKQLDWDYFIARTSYNRVVPLVLNTLQKVAKEKIPKLVAKRLFSVYDELSTKTHYNIIGLKKLLILFNGNNIPIIPFKGVMLGIYYKDLSLRDGYDIDIIIKKQDFYKVYDLLLLNGYKPELQHDYNELCKFLSARHSYPFTNKENITVDVHWALENENEGFRYPMEHIWEKHTKATYFDIEMAMLSPNDLFLSTCIHHGLRSSWCKLKFIFDFAVILDKMKQLNWKEIICTAEKLKIKNSILAGAFLANKLLEISVPFEINKALSKNKIVKRIEPIIYKRLFSDYNDDDKMIYDKWVKIYTSDKLVTTILKPNIKDQNFIRLPKYLYFIYYFIRPLRLLIQSKYFLGKMLKKGIMIKNS